MFIVGGECCARTSESSLRRKYDVLGTIGQGSFGRVLLAKHRATGLLVAVKVLEKEKLAPTSITSEVGILKDLQHENIVQLLEIIETEDEAHLVLEYVRRGTLRQHIRRTESSRLLEEEARPLFCEIVGAVQHCHEKGIVHGDLKTSNILIDLLGHPKANDFGLGFRFVPGKEVTAVGSTIRYCTPEVFSSGRYQGPPLDVWALGVILFEMVAGYPPFYGNKYQVIQQGLTGSYSFSYYFSQDLRNLIQKLLNPNPSRRPTLNEVLQHEWLEGAPSPSPPGPLPKSTKLAILNLMDNGGYDPLKVVDSVRYKTYNEEMATFMLLQARAQQGYSLRLQVKPDHQDVEAAPSPHTDPAPSALLPNRRASEPAACTAPFLPAKPSPQQGNRGSLPFNLLCQLGRTASACGTACQPSPATPSTSCPAGPEAPSSSPTSAPLSKGRRAWKAVKKTIIGRLQALCCRCWCPYKIPWGNCGHRVVPV